jgi:hypothetical protein
MAAWALRCLREGFSTPGVRWIACPGPQAGSPRRRLGLPVYPNLYESAWAGDMSDDTQTTRLGNLYTHDPFDKVYGWYKQQMPAGSETSESAASNHTTDDGDRAVMFDIGTTAGPKSKRVMITQNKGDGQTIIVLSDHITK